MTNIGRRKKKFETKTGINEEYKMVIKKKMKKKKEVNENKEIMKFKTKLKK